MRAEDKWAEKLRTKMDNYAEPLPDDMWKKIEHDMASPRVIPMWRRVWSYAAAVLVLLVSSLTVWFWNSTTTSYVVEQNMANEKLINEVTERVEAARENLVSTQQNAQLAEVAPSISQLETNQPMLADNVAADEYGIATASLMSDALVYSVDDGDETEECEAETLTQTDVQPEMKREAPGRSRMMSDRQVMMRNAKYMEHAKNDTKKKGWAIGVSAGNIPYVAAHSNSSMSSLSPHVAYKYVEDANSILRSSSGIEAFNQFETKVKHKLPITVGALFRYNFTPRWGIETGLSYTLLSSDWVSAEGVNVYQKLHYIGIPLKANYNILNKRFFTLYASAGGMMEKCIHAELGKRNGKYVGSDTESLSERPLQWSVSAAVGAQFNIVRQLGLFVEPGVTYYFDDNSVYQTIRKEHPFNFNLNLGLRVALSRR